MPYAQATVILCIVFLGGAITEAIHVHLVLGCFVAGILIHRSPGKNRNRETMESIWRLGMAFFIPFFFAYTGLKVDLTTLTGRALIVSVAGLAVACVGKVVGAGVGARIGGLSRWDALAVGVGRNARGAMELVIAAIGLSIGVLTLPIYSMIVLIAVITTLMAVPLLRFCVSRESLVNQHRPATPEEAAAR
jgi:Kef-type K+ transport system membrane component KefB